LALDASSRLTAATSRCPSSLMPITSPTIHCYPCDFGCSSHCSSLHCAKRTYSFKSGSLIFKPRHFQPDFVLSSSPSDCCCSDDFALTDACKRWPAHPFTNSHFSSTHSDSARLGPRPGY
jgi:hypothetical protein